MCSVVLTVCNLEREYVEWRQLHQPGICDCKITDVFGVQMQCSRILYVSDNLFFIAHFN